MIKLIELLAAGVTDDAGEPLENGTVTSYLAGTTTLETLYEDFGLEEPHANPLTLDEAGRIIAFCDERVKLVISDSDGAVVRTIDNVGTSDSDIPTSASQAIPPGVTADYAGSSAPTGWLECNGAAVNRSTYSALFAAIGETFGVGDSSTTFNLPDLRGRTSIGSGTGTDLSARTLGATVGVESVTLTGPQSGIAAHTHTVTDPGHTHVQNLSAGAGGAVDLSALLASSGSVNGGTTDSSTTGISNQNAGPTTAVESHTNMQPSLVMMKIIKT